MTSCPSSEVLAAILRDDHVDDAVIDHLGYCEACREKLLELSVEFDDWKEWEEMMQEDSISWAAVEEPSPFAHADLAEMDDTSALGDTFAHTGSAPVSAVVKQEDWLGDYQLLERIGAGGMGVVYRAYQASAGRTVALKLIRPEQLDALPQDRKQGWLDRFRSEAQTAARLEHDHVVTIYDVGEIDGKLFYSMQLIDGPSLTEIIREGPIDNHRAATLMHQVALAVDQAHQQGILHRDLKPQNILIRKSGSRPSHSWHGGSKLESGASTDVAGERPYVADFGLAKCLEEGAEGTTHTGEVMGSPSYMSPEQAQDASRCTPASDIYSLGASLYDALTGRPPFRASSPLETLRQVIDKEPVEPRELNPAIDLDLQTITLKALSKEPSRRYLSAAAMAADLIRYLNGEPIEARPISAVERSLRWCQRNPLVSGLGGFVVALLIFVAVGSVVSAIRLQAMADGESRARAQETLARTKAERFFTMSLGVIDDMLADYGDESLAHVPQMDEARKELLKKALGHYVQLAAAEPTSSDLQVEFARTQYRVANLHDLLGEQDEARLAYDQAIRLFQELEQHDPENAQVCRWLANSHTMLGEVLRRTSPGEALRHFQQAVQSQHKLHALNPGNTEYRRELSRTLNNLGLLYTETGREGLSETRLGEAVTHLRELADIDSQSAADRAEVLSDLGRSLINLGVLLRKLPDRISEAEIAYHDAIECLREATELSSDNRDYQFRLAVATLDLGNLVLSSDNDGPTRSRELTTQAEDRLARLSDAFPGVPLYRYERANAINSTAVALAILGDQEAASSQFHNAIDLLDQLDRQFPAYTKAEPKYHSLRGRLAGGLAYVHSQSGNWREARTMVDAAITAQQHAVELHAENPEFVEFLSQHYDFLATILTQLGSTDEADRAKSQAGELRQRVDDMKSSQP